MKIANVGGSYAQIRWYGNVDLGWNPACRKKREEGSFKFIFGVVIFDEYHCALRLAK